MNFPEKAVRSFLTGHDFHSSVIERSLRETKKYWIKKGKSELSLRDFEDSAYSRAETMELEKASKQIEIGEAFYKATRFTTI